MTTPTKQQLDESEQIPTTMPGLAYSLVKIFGAWALIAFATAVLWVQYKETNSRLMSMLETNILASHASTKAVESMAAEIKNDRENSEKNLSKMDSSLSLLMETVRENKTMLKDHGVVARENLGVLHDIKARVEKLGSQRQ
jgi:hypothetical protein